MAKKDIKDILNPTSGNPRILKIRVGDVTGEVINDKDGMEYKSNASQFDDLQIHINAMDSDNPNPPLWKLSNHSGNVSTAHYLNFENGTDEDTWLEVPKATINDLDYTNTPDWTLSFWITPESRGSGILEIASQLAIDIDYNDALRLKWGNQTTVTLLNRVTYGKRYHILISSEDRGSGNTRVRAYVNNRRKMNKLYGYQLGSSYSTSWLFGARGSNGSGWWTGDLSIDELILLNDHANTTTRTELYNDGEGRVTLPTQFSSGDDLMWIHFDESSGTTISNESGTDGTITGTHYSWLVGGIDGSHSISGGIKGLWFEAGEGQEINFTVQNTHKLPIGGHLPFHLHVKMISSPVDVAHEPVFKMEYVVTNIGEEEQPTITLTSEGVMGSFYADVNNYHKIITFPTITQTNNGTDIKPSAMIEGRLYRDDSDLFSDGIFLKQGDFHIENVQLGTKVEWV